MRQRREFVRESKDYYLNQSLTTPRTAPNTNAEKLTTPKPSDLTTRQQAVLTMQHRGGNGAVLRMLDQQRAYTVSVRRPTVQRCACGGDPANCSCEEEQDEQGAAGDSVQRLIGDGHDLTSPRFAKNETLEAAYDNEKEIKLGDKGEPVRKLQQALIDSDEKLPVFGADGIFGDETEAAVKDFQHKARVPEAKRDGVVRGETMQRLDVIFPPDSRSSAPPPEKTDFQVKGKYKDYDAVDHPKRIFFDYNDAALDSEEKAKVTTQAKPTDQDLTLFGFASEEGGVAGNVQLINNRIASVKEELGNAGHDASKITTKPGPDRGIGRIDYRFMRAVEIVSPDSKSETPDCKGKGAKEDCGTVFHDTQALATKLIDQTIAALSADKLEDRTKAALKRIHVSEAKIPTLITNLKAIKDKLDVYATEHECHNFCDPSCASGTEAYVTGTEGPVVVCPRFIDEKNDDFRSEVLIHEASHGTPGLETNDTAYSYQRLSNLLTEEESIKTADSYLLLVGLIRDPSGSASNELKAPVEDKLVGITDPKEKNDVQHALAFTERTVQYAKSHVAGVYDIVKNAKGVGYAPHMQYEYQMSILAPRFGLTSPPHAPTERDQEALAAIDDRYQQMQMAMKKTQLTVTKDATGKDSWSAGPGTSLTLTPAFFALSDMNAKTEFLIRLLVEATPNISPEFVPKYVESATLIRQHVGEIEPR